tara:strand:- start:12904 stop:13416 length:513 start_codon:yes stop_codon:yes gene_type:complete
MSMFRKKLFYFIYFRVIGSHFPSIVSFRGYLLRGLLDCSVDNLVVRADVYLSGYERLSIGDHLSINHGCFLSCEGGLEIGNHVAIGHGTSILTTEHGYTNTTEPIKYQPVSYKGVKIGNDVWIGANVTILAGVSIADGTVVAAGAVVARSIQEPNTIVGGVPAKFIKTRV